jgi:uncharacterized BrkB/YihY/UPF0761 family membrane protein
LRRAGTAAAIGLSILVLALAAYLDIAQRDPTALLFGILVVVLLWVVVTATKPGARLPPRP